MDRTQRLSLLAAIMGSFVVGLDSTVVNVALPAIEEDLGGGLAGQQWISNGYLLALAALILVGGSLGDVFGERRVFSIGLVGFGATSMVCALAPTIEVMVAGRVAQGVFGALLTPSALAVIVAAFPPAQRGAGGRLVAGVVGHRDRDRAARRRPADRRGLVALDLRDQRRRSSRRRWSSSSSRCRSASGSAPGRRSTGRARCCRSSASPGRRSR